MTGNVIDFPIEAARVAPLRLVVVSDEPDNVVILPVVRIERHPEKPFRRKVSRDICGND